MKRPAAGASVLLAMLNAPDGSQYAPLNVRVSDALRGVPHRAFLRFVQREFAQGFDRAAARDDPQRPRPPSVVEHAEGVLARVLAAGDQREVRVAEFKQHLLPQQVAQELADLFAHGIGTRQGLVRQVAFEGHVLHFRCQAVPVGKVRPPSLTA
jgi:hypothetical protein